MPRLGEEQPALRGEPDHARQPRDGANAPVGAAVAKTPQRDAERRRQPQQRDAESRDDS